MKQLPPRSTKKSKGAVCDDESGLKECVEKIGRGVVDHQ
jgi:hypothetical protein